MEIEAKFILPDRDTLARLESIHQMAGLTLSTSRSENVLDVYLDTAQHAIFRAGYSCRERHMDAQVLMTLKGLDGGRGGVFRREELEVALAQPLPPVDWPPSPARTRTLEIVGDQPLVPWFKLRQKRLVRQIFDGRRFVGELSLDDVCIKTSTKTLNFFEVEAEIREEGTSDDLDRIAAILRDEWHLQPEPRSKFERALGFIGAVPRRRKPRTKRSSSPPAAPFAPPSHAGITIDDTMAEAARKTLNLHLQRMLWHEEGVRAGQDPEALHDMRVATRRMRAALRVFEGHVRRRTIKPYARILRRAGRILGTVRDMDVFREKAERYLESLPPERRSELDPLLKAWQEEYARSREEMIAFLDGGAFERLKKEFAELLTLPGALDRPVADGKPTTSYVAHVLPIILFGALARLQAFEPVMQQPQVPLVRYHQLRIASKSMRYTLEFFQEVLSPEAATAIDQVKRLQEHLGQLQDAVVTCNKVRDFLVWGSWGHGKSQRQPMEAVLAPGVALYLSFRQTEIENLIKTFPEVWSPIIDPGFRQRLVTLVGSLPAPSIGATRS